MQDKLVFLLFTRRMDFYHKPILIALQVLRGSKMKTKGSLFFPTDNRDSRSETHIDF